MSDIALMKFSGKKFGLILTIQFRFIVFLAFKPGIIFWRRSFGIQISLFNRG
jgi:hypothetical protein